MSELVTLNETTSRVRVYYCNKHSRSTVERHVAVLCAVSVLTLLRVLL